MYDPACEADRARVGDGDADVGWQVDMVLLAGDLFHDNKPSRKAMYQVMRTLRKNCLGMKPCELEFLSDPNEIFEGAFNHVNYEDPDINISIPVFSIHGNHDDPSGDGHFCSLDLLQVAGLVNYFGRIPEADKIQARPILLQKGRTKLALYGLSNVRDERMFRTFRDGKVTWFRPNVQQSDWFNLLALHQNHHAHTATGYLPENVLPDWLDLVVWGHEHECLIDPVENPQTGFHVMQPGSSVATSLVPGEAVPKHVAIVTITGREFSVEKIPLKSVRPFVIREIVLATDKRFENLAKKKDNRQELTRRLMAIVDEMIAEANEEWQELHRGDPNAEQPLPLIRLKVEYTAPEGGNFDIENPQRFSNRFVGRVANTNDVVYFHRKKTTTRVCCPVTLLSRCEYSQLCRTKKRGERSSRRCAGRYGCRRDKSRASGAGVSCGTVAQDLTSSPIRRRSQPVCEQGRQACSGSVCQPVARRPGAADVESGSR